jgi:LuxR family maltose regulon positive regulatory protein
LFALVRSLAIEGDDAAARVEHARAAVEVARTGNHALLTPTLANLGLALLLVGKLEEAWQAAHEAATCEDAERRPNGYVVSLACLAAIDAERGRPEHASASARTAIEYARSRGLEENWVAALAHLALADSFAQTGQFADAEREANRGEKLWRKSQASPGHVYALIRLAEVRAARGRPRQARTALDAANRQIAEFPDPGRLPSLAAAVEADLAAAPASGLDLVEPPSPGELAVLHYLPTDLTHREIAARLFISLNTVRTHIRALYRKLQVRSREEAVGRAEALGLLDLSESPR